MTTVDNNFYVTFSNRFSNVVDERTIVRILFASYINRNLGRRLRFAFQDKRREPRENVEARGKAVRGVGKALALALAFPFACCSRATSHDMLVTRVAPAEQTGIPAAEPLVLRLLGSSDD